MMDYQVFETTYESPDHPEFIGIYTAKSEAQAVNFARYEKYGRRSFKYLGTSMTAVPVKRNKTQEVKMSIFETLKPYEGKRRSTFANDSSDVSVGLTKGSAGAIDNISFVFRNGCYNLFSKSDRIGFEIARDQDRIIVVFFPEGTRKLVKMKHMETSRYLKIKLDGERLILAQEMIGSYNLCKDTKSKLYYIQKVIE